MEYSAAKDDAKWLKKEAKFDKYQLSLGNAKTRQFINLGVDENGPFITMENTKRMYLNNFLLGELEDWIKDAKKVTKKTSTINNQNSANNQIDLIIMSPI